MRAIVGAEQPAFNMDDVHRRTLPEALAHAGIDAFTEDDREALWRAWHELDAWPDFPAALARLRTRLPVVSFTMLPTSLVVDVSRRNGMSWDAVISCEMIGMYKPHAEAYATAARWLALPPSQIMMVACHNFDLNAAHRAGYRTAFVRRPAEWGPEPPPEPEPNMDYDHVVDGFDALAEQILARAGAPGASRMTP
jgi:2-haloacid dehalogenase